VGDASRLMISVRFVGLVRVQVVKCATIPAGSPRGLDIETIYYFREERGPNYHQNREDGSFSGSLSGYVSYG